jgi:hypothetical protein
MLHDLPFNSGDVRYSRFVDTDMYWARALTGGDGGDSAGDGGDGVGDPTSSSDIPSDLLYMLNSLPFNSGDVRCSRFVDRDRYSAGGAHGWG